MHPAHARFGALWAHHVEDVRHDLDALRDGGCWAAVLPYSGPPTLIRFGRWSHETGPAPGPWVGPAVDAWRSSMDETEYVAAVEATRQRIARGDLYQANICRVLRAALPVRGAASVSGLLALLEAGNPAPFASCIQVPEAGIAIASASPELFLRRDGSSVMSSPIKGTGRTAGDLQDKDLAENVMIVDLVRNDLSRVCRPGTVEVPSLLRTESHPGLVHLVSDVCGELLPHASWSDIIEASFPPGSVTGAPKSAAERLIAELEPAERGVYCGAIGWIDADRQRAELAVAIRTFWVADEFVHFGTGAGITWGSDPVGEWQETQLKAERLIGLAAGVWQGEGS